MTGFSLLEYWFFMGADVHCLGAAWVETATDWWLKRAGDISFQDNSFTGYGRVGTAGKGIELARIEPVGFILHQEHPNDGRGNSRSLSNAFNLFD